MRINIFQALAIKWIIIIGLSRLARRMLKS